MTWDSQIPEIKMLISWVGIRGSIIQPFIPPLEVLLTSWLRIHLFSSGPHNWICLLSYFFFLSFFTAVCLMYDIVWVTDAQHSDSECFKFHYTHISYKILAVFHVLYSIFLQLSYFIHNSLYLLTPALILSLPCSLPTLVTTSLSPISVSLFIFCYIH